jgi:tetratricopeptide (TPR) repeat protein
MKTAQTIPFLSALLLGLASFSSATLSSDALAGEVAKARAQAKLSKECVDPKAYSTLETCPAGPKQFGGKDRHKAAFKTAPPPRERKAQVDGLGQRNASEEMTAGQRDRRTTRLQARSRALLITEISGLERLFNQTKKKSKDRQQLVRRLAEGYVELESAANRDMIESQIAADDAKRKKQRNTYNKAKSEEAKAKKILEASRQKAIAYYKVMKNDYPDYSKLDEVLYYLAYEYEQAGDLENARKVYLELIEKAPKSQYVPNAYLAFGELFFNEAMADPSKWALAATAYQKVIEYPPPKNTVYGYAHYKLAYVHWNSEEYGEAIEEFKEVIDFGNKFPKDTSAAQLQKAARRDLIPVYAVAGDPKKAYNFFKPLSGDSGGEDAKTLDMLNELGLAYMDTGHYGQGIALYEDLMTRDKGDRYCGYQTQISQATQAMYSGDKIKIKKELDEQLQVKDQFSKGKHSKEAIHQCANDTAGLLSESAMSWHLEAVGTGGTRGTGDKETMALASYLYQKVVDNYTQADFETYEFPRIVKEDWPNIYKIRYAMADLLYVQERWEDCGPAFDAVVAENPNSPEAPEAAYASVLCYQKMYDQLHKDDDPKKGKGLGPKNVRGAEESKGGEWEKFKPKDFTDMQKGMIQAFNRYVCYIKPPEGNKQAYDQYVEVKYARARTYFEAQHWEEAALGFRDVALNHTDHDSSIYAAQLYLESINVIGSKTEPPRPACFEEMGNDVPAFLELFCEGPKYEENKEQCDLLTRIQCDVRRLRAEKIIEIADKGAADALVKYKEGGDAYIEIWRTYGEQQLEAGGESQCGRMEEVLFNAAQAYQAGRLLAKAISVRQLLLNPKYNLQETELAKKSIYQLGRNYQAIAVYDAAAKYLMRYAEATSYKGEDADKAVSDAVVLNLGLGLDQPAIDAAQAFNRNYGRSKPKEAAQIAFAIAAHYGEKKDWQEVKNKLAGSAIGLIDKQATLDVQVQAHALLAKAYVEMKVGTTAAREYRTVLGAWEDPKKATAAIESIAGEDPATRQRRLGRALTSVGEALFFFAEKKRDKVNAVKFPEYRGPGDKDAVLKHINTKVKEWIAKKKPLIEDASADYKKIVDLQPLPPPNWVIAAGARVGEMWATFVKEFRAAPIPDSMKKDYEIRTAYYGALDDASEPLKQIGKGAYVTCLDYSVKYQYFDEFSRECEKWLAEEYKAEFHLVDEFRGAPNRVNSVLKERPYPLQANGDPMVVALEAAPPGKAAKKEEKKDEDK